MELNKIYQEDCLILMKEMPNNFIDMTITSPPYNIALMMPKYKEYNMLKGEPLTPKQIVDMW